MNIKVSKDFKALDAPVLYDATAEQRIVIEIPKGSKSYTVFHQLKPLDDERYFKLETEVETQLKRFKKFSTEIFNPRHELWKELAIGREGYAEREDWLDATKEGEAVQAVNALLFTQIAATTEESGLLDDSADTPIEFIALFSGARVELTHYFREETKQEKDRYLSITANEADSNSLASAVKKPKNQRLYELGVSMITKTEGYANQVIPAWHIAKTTETYFDQVVFGRLGKLGGS